MRPRKIFSFFFFATRRRKRPARQRRDGGISSDEAKYRSCASLNGGALAQAANVADAKSRTAAKTANVVHLKSRTAAKFRRGGLSGVNSADVPKKVDRSTPARSSSRRTPIGLRGNVATAELQATRQNAGVAQSLTTARRPKRQRSPTQNRERRQNFDAPDGPGSTTPTLRRGRPLDADASRRSRRTPIGPGGNVATAEFQATRQNTEVAQVLTAAR